MMVPMPPGYGLIFLCGVGLDVESYSRLILRMTTGNGYVIGRLSNILI
jgi:hypothetical protein